MASRHGGTSHRRRHVNSAVNVVYPEKITVDAGDGDRPVISDADAKMVHGLLGSWQCTFVPSPIETGQSDPAGPNPPPSASVSAGGNPLSSSNRFMELGRISSYNAATNLAMVRLITGTAEIGPMPVTACAPRDMNLVGAACLIVLRGPTDTAGGVIAAVWPWPGVSAPLPVSSMGGKTYATGVAGVPVSASTSGSVAVALPSGFNAAPVVVATADDTRFYAVVSGITASSFTLAVVAQSALSATVPVNWIAVGN